MYAHLTNVASFDALLGEIRDLLNSTGDWTINQDLITPDEGVAAGGRQLVMTNGTMLVGLRSTTTGNGANRLYLFDGIAPFSGTLDTLNGNSGIRYTDAEIVSINDPGKRNLQAVAGPFPNAHLFTDDPSTYLHVAIEVQTGIWDHLAFGHLRHFGSWTGGGYYGLTRWATNSTDIDNPGADGHVVPFDNNNNGSSSSWTVHYEDGGSLWIHPNTADVTLNGVVRKCARGTFRGGTARMFKNFPESPFSGRIPLGPVLIQRYRVEDTPNTIRWIGQVPDMHTVNITNIAPAGSIFIGADEFVCFPVKAKNGAVDQYNSGVVGVAYLKHP